MKRSKPSNDGVSASKPTHAKETDQHKIEMRLKQVQYGYNTAAYDNYIGQVPKNQRSTQYDKHPRTPDPYMAQSKRSFDGRLRKWRRELHRWDPKEGALGESVTFKVAPKVRPPLRWVSLPWKRRPTLKLKVVETMRWAMKLLERKIWDNLETTARSGKEKLRARRTRRISSDHLVCVSWLVHL